MLQNEISLGKSLPLLKFWESVSKIRKGDASLMYPTLLKMVTLVFCLPHSTACVERIFSAITLNMTNRWLALASLSGILHSKWYLAGHQSIEIKNLSTITIIQCMTKKL